MEESQLFEKQKGKFLEQEGIEVGTMMGFPCLRIEKEFFASAHPQSGNLIVKLPADRVEELIQKDQGHAFAPNGKRFKEWLEISNRDELVWDNMMKEALAFVSIKALAKKSQKPGKATSKDVYFSEKLFEFLQDLSQNNNRDWFQQNKKRYETDVKQPFLALIANLIEGLAELSPNVIVDPHPSKGSMLRINRDTRFSKDKTPYKTGISAFFHLHGTKKSDHPAGYYLHIGLDQCFVGAGVWHPKSGSLEKIRQAILTQAKQWQTVLDGPFQLGGESYKKAPKGIDPNHQFIEDLKRKDFVASVELAPEDVYGKEFREKYLEGCKKLKPLMDFLEGCLLEK